MEAECAVEDESHFFALRKAVFAKEWNGVEGLLSLINYIHFLIFTFLGRKNSPNRKFYTKNETQPFFAQKCWISSSTNSPKL
jgi:hypothetical protein